MVSSGDFRKDLFYRLNVISLHIPPLRDRRNDIGLIARQLLHKLAQEATLPDIRLTPDAEDTLSNYDWPGNVRELSNVLERSLSSIGGDIILRENLPFYIHRETHLFKYHRQ